MPETAFLVKAAVLSLRRFTVKELCEYTGLRRSQVDPILAELKKQEIVVEVRDETTMMSRAAQRPTGTYELSSTGTKVQAIANEVYRVRRAVAPAENNDADIGAVQREIEHLQLLLNVCDTATRLKSLGRFQLQRIEKHVQSVYTRLEIATYKRGLNIRENAEHPIASSWTQWQQCVEQLKAIITRWQLQRNAISDAFAAIILPQRTPVNKIQVVTDPSFLDSALFLWIFKQQPLLRAGLDIEFELQAEYWDFVPACVAKQKNAIGFYNRHLSQAATRAVAYWTDLCVYRGYALLAHATDYLTDPPLTLPESERFLKRFLDECRANGFQPTVISIGADTDWRFGERLTPGVNRSEFAWHPIANSADALEAFRGNPYALFVGGLPQRLQAQREGCISVLDARLKPGLHSVNGLIFNSALTGKATALLQSVAALWFDTVSRLRNHPVLRKEAIAGIHAMFQQLEPHTALPFDESMFDEVFGSHALEFFPQTPAEIARFVTELQIEKLRSELASHPESEKLAESFIQDRGMDEPRLPSDLELVP